MIFSLFVQCQNVTNDRVCHSHYHVPPIILSSLTPTSLIPLPSRSQVLTYFDSYSYLDPATSMMPQPDAKVRPPMPSTCFLFTAFFGNLIKFTSQFLSHCRALFEIHTLFCRNTRRSVKLATFWVAFAYSIMCSLSLYLFLVPSLLFVFIHSSARSRSSTCTTPSTPRSRRRR